MLPGLGQPRRVLLTTDAVGGVWRHAVDVAGGFSARGVEVVLAGLGPRPSPRQAAEVESLPGVHLVWLDASLDWLADRPADVAGFPSQLAALVAESGVDLVHLCAPAQAVGVDLDVPVVASVHSCVATWWAAVRGASLPDNWDWRVDLTRRGLAAADHVVAPSASFATALRAAYGPLPHLSVVRNGRPAPATAPCIAKGAFVLAAGRWWDDAKNLAAIDAAAAQAAWPVRLAGSLAGPNGTAALPEAAEPIGEIGPEEMARLYAQTAVFLSPALYEPFGLAVLEAAQSGAALVLSDIDTFRELWDGAAVFVDARDPQAIAAALNALAADPARRAALGAAARRRAADYTLDAQVEALLALYAGALAERGPVPARRLA